MVTLSRTTPQRAPQEQSLLLPFFRKEDAYFCFASYSFTAFIVLPTCASGFSAL